ncbi:hypothetical protein [Burkholderia pseudomallei]|uniref:hypothetical protein n=1 Tax=Burkholderia pseudomallei TaxID=28450 RepID=UPI001AD77607|nr:hypothetical protein [Burkholderia pseudomallei]
MDQLAMLLFLDTEYTGLGHRYGQHGPKLISLALVAEDGSREFYVELADTWIPEECTPFVLREVLPLLDGPRLRHANARASLRAWLMRRAACRAGRVRLGNRLVFPAGSPGLAATDESG